MNALGRAAQALIADLHRQAEDTRCTTQDNGRRAQVDGSFEVAPLVRAVVSAIRPPTPAADVRGNLARLIEERGSSMAELSRMLGRNPAYLQQFLQRGSPERLDEDDRLKLAQHFNVDERLLGARDPWMPGQ